MENKKLSFDEIIKIVKSVEENNHREVYDTDGISIYAFAHGYYDSKKIGLGEVKLVKRVSNSDEVYYVNYFVEHDVYIRTNAYYDSYQSVEDFDDCDSYGFEVKPIEKVVTFYE
jgi:hypothetical protein